MNGADLLEGPGIAIAIGAAFLLLALIVLLRHKAASLRHQPFPPFPFSLKGKLDPPNLAFWCVVVMGK